MPTVDLQTDEIRKPNPAQREAYGVWSCIAIPIAGDRTQAASLLAYAE